MKEEKEYDLHKEAMACARAQLSKLSEEALLNFAKNNGVVLSSSKASPKNFKVVSRPKSSVIKD